MFFVCPNSSLMQQALLLWIFFSGASHPWVGTTMQFQVVFLVQKSFMVSIATSVPSECRISWWVCYLCSMLKLHLMWVLFQLPAQTSGTHSVGQLHLWLLPSRSKLYHGGPSLGSQPMAASLAPSTPNPYRAHRYPKSYGFFVCLFVF